MRLDYFLYTTHSFKDLNTTFTNSANHFVKCSSSFWGSYRITVQGFEGFISPRQIRDTALRIFMTNSDLSMEERQHAEALLKRFEVLHEKREKPAYDKIFSLINEIFWDLVYGYVGYRKHTVFGRAGSKKSTPHNFSFSPKAKPFFPAKGWNHVHAPRPGRNKTSHFYRTRFRGTAPRHFTTKFR